MHATTCCAAFGAVEPDSAVSCNTGKQHGHLLLAAEPALRDGQLERAEQLLQFAGTAGK